MDWGTLMATITGAVIGVGATMIAERAQWRRSQDHHWKTVRREAYAAYLAALSNGSVALRQVVRERAPQDLDKRLYEVIAANASWHLFHTIAMVGPADVVGKAEEAQLALRDTRDALLEHPDLDHKRYLEAREQLLSTMGGLRNAMRADLRLPSLGTVRASPRW